MRLRRESLLLLGVLTAVCALAGIVAGIATGALVEAPAPPPTNQLQVVQPASQPAPSTTPAAAIVTPSAPGSQRALLVIGVDDLDSPDPRFEGCWVLTYRSGDSNYYGLSFPVGAAYTVPGLDGPRTLAQVFSEDVHQQRGYAFLRDAIRSVFPAFHFDAELVLDRGDFSSLLAEVGTINLAGQLASSVDIWQTYDTFAPSDESKRLAYQQQVFEALFLALGSQGWTPTQVSELLASLPHTQASPARVTALTAYAAEAPPLKDAVLNWTSLPPAAP